MVPSATLSRRALLGTALSAGAASLIGARATRAQAPGVVNFTAWSAAIDQVKVHIGAFEEAQRGPIPGAGHDRKRRPRHVTPVGQIGQVEL